MSREEIMAVVKKNLISSVEGIDDAKFNPGLSMKDLGANSLDIVEVVSCSMRDLKVKIPRTELSKLTNIDGLVDLFYQVKNNPV